MAKVGDTVRFLSTTGGGRVVKIDGQIAHVEEDDGFVTPVLLKELVVVSVAGEETSRRDIFGGTGQKKQEQEKERQSKFVPTTVPEAPKPAPVAETPGGDTLNVVLAYEAVELKHLTTTTFEAYLVNDSNYYLYFTYLSRADEESGWTTRFAGLVEPNMQIFLEELSGDQVGRLDRVAFQYVAFKRDKEFKLKAPVAIETHLDTTKFFKLHCFRENTYFDEPVIAIDIVKNDIPQRSMVFDSSSIEDAMRQKRAADRRPSARPVQKSSRRRGRWWSTCISTNLSTIPTVCRMPIYSTTRLMLSERRWTRTCVTMVKIVFIHGKGEGILRQALMKELNYRYKGHDVQDASFREYGYGATQVTIR